jgi:hypothetical protein
LHMCEYPAEKLVVRVFPICGDADLSRGDKETIDTQNKL